jgi:hypothetical protein
MDELSNGRQHKSEFMWKEALAPVAENFESWNITRDGIRFNFDACKVFSCAGGEKAIEIPFSALEDILDRESAINVPA